MEEAKGVVKHILLAKFNRIDQLAKGYANLVTLIEPIKAFKWGLDVSLGNKHQGFAHVFGSTFESVEGVAEYLVHPAHVDFAKLFDPSSDTNQQLSISESKV